MSVFRVALSRSFVRADGRWNFPGFDLARLRDDSSFEVVQLSNGPSLTAADLLGFHGLILVGDTLPKAALPLETELVVVARFGVGFDKVDVRACTQAGVALTVTPNAVRRPVAVAALTLVLALAGRVRIKDRLTRQGSTGYAKRTDQMGVGLEGRVLAGVGLGNIGAEMFRLARPLGMRFIAYDPYASPATASEIGVTLVGLDTVFADADFLCIHCPLTDETRGLVNSVRLATMKRSAFLINTARGAIVDQPALEQALARGNLAGAGLDVLDPEPPSPDAAILELDNVILTPHSLAWTDQCFAAMGDDCIRSTRAVAHGEIPQFLVNKDVLDQQTFRTKIANWARERSGTTGA